jgi:hypothetical protein
MTANSGGNFPSALPQPGDNPEKMYQILEEPLLNPDKQYATALDQLRSGDWSKQFEACNTLKRVAMFHKPLLSNQNSFQPQIIKELIKLVDNLRS